MGLTLDEQEASSTALIRVGHTMAIMGAIGIIFHGNSLLLRGAREIDVATPLRRRRFCFLQPTA